VLVEPSFLLHVNLEVVGLVRVLPVQDLFSEVVELPELAESVEVSLIDPLLFRVCDLYYRLDGIKYGFEHLRVGSVVHELLDVLGELVPT